MDKLNLSHKICVPCEGGTKPLVGKELDIYFESVKDGWQLGEGKKMIKKEWKVKNFKAALNFVNKVGEIAEQEGHHPDIHIVNYNHVVIELSTHSIGGLSINDFIVASKIDLEEQNRKSEANKVAYGSKHK